MYAEHCHKDFRWLTRHKSICLGSCKCRSEADIIAAQRCKAITTHFGSTLHTNTKVVIRCQYLRMPGMTPMFNCRHPSCADVLAMLGATSRPRDVTYAPFSAVWQIEREVHRCVTINGNRKTDYAAAISPRYSKCMPWTESSPAVSNRDTRCRDMPDENV